MTLRPEDVHDVDAHAFAAAWTAFADDDARTGAPPALETRVREAARAECQRRQCAGTRVRQYKFWAGLGAAAALLILAVVGGLSSRRLPNPPIADVVESHAAPIDANRNPPRNAPSDDGLSTGPTRSTVVSDARLPRARIAPSVLASFAIDQIQDTEELAVVRLRVPQDALAALGIATTEPASAGLVDIDVLIGGDGLPRDIRRVRAVLSAEDRR